MNDNNKCEDCNDSWREHELFYILTDLIAELRTWDWEHTQNPGLISPFVVDCLDRAEARLKGLTDV